MAQLLIVVFFDKAILVLYIIEPQISLSFPDIKLGIRACIFFCHNEWQKIIVLVIRRINDSTMSEMKFSFKKVAPRISRPQVLILVKRLSMRDFIYRLIFI